MMRALSAEFRKLKRSRMPLWSVLIVLVAAGLGMAVLPVLAAPSMQAEIAKSGGVFAKAIAAGAYDLTWTNVMRSTPQGLAGSWGLLTYGLLAAWLFGREFKERTASTMLTLPIRREYAVLAKLVVLAVWIAALALLAIALTSGIALVLGAAGFGWDRVLKGLVDQLAVSGLIYLTLPVVAWLAMLGKGYLRPMLYSMVLMTMTTALIDTPISRWLPWSMSVHLIGASWYPVPPVGPASGAWVVAVLFFLVGVAALMWRIDRADSPR